MNLLALLLSIGGTATVIASGVALWTSRPTSEYQPAMILCDAPSPDDNLRCDQEMGHLAWHRCDGSEWYGDTWAVDEWADTQEALVDPEPTMSAAQWEAEFDIWLFPVDEDGNYLGTMPPVPVGTAEAKQDAKVVPVERPLPELDKIPANLGYRLLGAAACIAIPLIATWGMGPHTSEPVAQAADTPAVAPELPVPAKAWDTHGREAPVTTDKLTYANPWWLNPVTDSAGRLHWPDEQWGSSYNTVDLCLEVAAIHQAWGCAAQSHSGIVDVNHVAKIQGWDSETYYVVNLIG